MAAPLQPKTLGSARAVIRELQAKMGLLRSSESAPAPPVTPAPARPVVPAPLPNLVPKPPDLGNMSLSPKALREFFDNSTTAELRACLSRETAKNRKGQNPSVIAQLYRELKGRK